MIFFFVFYGPTMRCSENVYFGNLIGRPKTQILPKKKLFVELNFKNNFPCRVTLDWKVLGVLLGVMVKT